MSIETKKIGIIVLGANEKEPKNNSEEKIEAGHYDEETIVAKVEGSHHQDNWVFDIFLFEFLNTILRIIHLQESK